MFDGRFRHAVDRSTKPVGNALMRAGVTPDVLTVFGLAMSVLSAVVVGSGHLVVGIFMLFAVGLPDLFDGAVAKTSGRASVRGAFFDSVADRVSDAFLYGGVAWYLAARHHGQAVLLPFAILAVTSLISYERAKAELLGLSAKGGLMERAERFILLGFCYIAGAVSASAFVPALWVFLAMVTVTAVGRFVRVWKLAEGPATPAPAPTLFGARLAHSERGPARVRRQTRSADSRWQAWREGRSGRELAGSRPMVPLGHGQPGEPPGRWRTRLSGGSGPRAVRTWRDRRATRPRERTGRRPGSAG